MIKNILFLLWCCVFIGCASTGDPQLNQKYLEIYNNGLNTDSVISVVKTESYREIKQRLSDEIVSHGYTKVVFEDQKQGFIVLAKEESPALIILKYTSTEGKYKTRLDLVNGSNDLNTDKMVRKDIQEIVDQLKY